MHRSVECDHEDIHIVFWDDGEICSVRDFFGTSYISCDDTTPCEEGFEDNGWESFLEARIDEYICLWKYLGTDIFSVLHTDKSDSFSET